MSDALNALTQQTSPFHPGEQKLQTEAGKRQAMETFGRRVIRSYMPDQHRRFYEQLPFLVVGTVDAQGRPWANLISGNPGFIQSPDEHHLEITVTGDTQHPAIQHLADNTAVGLLGIELHTRRRNRMNGRVSGLKDGRVRLRVDQAFGNCPQYIQHRSLSFIRDPEASSPTTSPQSFETLDASSTQIIREADTFFVSSYVPLKNNPTIEGVDVSHRGGRPGFVKVEGNTLTIPDFPGNYHFNTLGNFLLNPKAGLVFPDFRTGTILSLTGQVELLDSDAPELAFFAGAERGWRFTVTQGIRLEDALPFRAERGDFSPNTLLCGTWEEAKAQANLEAQKNTWRPFRITKTAQESSVIRSFFLEPADDLPLAPFKPGQFLTVRVVPEGSDTPQTRTYTISSAPNEQQYRLSIKFEERGTVSRHFHNNLNPGDIIQIKAPKGGFHLDTTETRPAVLLAGGVGITPMIAIARHILNEGVRTRHMRPVTILHASQTTTQRAFNTEFQKLSTASNQTIRYLSVVSRPRATERQGRDFDCSGRITSEMLRRLLPLDDYDFYLCGPPSFMQAMYDNLRSLGVRDARIQAEAFGPASLKRDRMSGQHVTTTLQEIEADTAVVSFAASQFEQRWEEGGDTLLELAEAHGITPEFSCRSGSCGSCATRILEGGVVYRTPPTAHISDDEALICCAVPAKGTKRLTLEL